MAHSYDLQRAVEMATKVEGTHLLVKVGHGPYYFPETTRLLANRVRSLGFRPLAWTQLTDRAPAAAFKGMETALTLGYEGVVLLVKAALVTARQLEPLAVALRESDVPLSRLILASPPLSHLPDRGVLELFAPLCQGGWMPLCFPDWELAPKELIDREVYQSMGELSRLWDTTPDVYPVLSTRRTGENSEPFLPEDLIPWTEGIMRHGVDFFSVYHAASTEKAFWPIVEATGVACQGEAAPAESTEPGVVVPQPVYVTVTTDDTVWGLIGRYEMTRAQFWEWNAHLWDSRGLPRDADYLQEGWRVRVK
jgi:hypothetical protein